MMNFILFFYRLLKVLYTKIHASFISSRFSDSCEDVIEVGNEYEFFITNSIGGGTAVFTENYIQSVSNILILRNISYGQDWIFILENPKSKKMCCLKFKDIAQLINRNFIKKITINSLVSNLHTFDLINLLKETDKKITVMVHDYYLICPNYVLFENNMFCNFRFCNIAVCLKNTNAFLIPHCLSIQSWREKWHALLNKVDEIRCFSTSSKEIIKSIYPDIQDEQFTIVPHDMSYCSFFSVPYQRKYMHVGIIGAISSNQKGRLVVRDFLLSAKKRNVNVSIIGAYSFIFKIRGKTINYTGPYKQNVLPKIILDEKVNVVFFPSVWPETFSYLVSEVIKMALPIVCFDYGAQAEKVRTYSKGIVCSSTQVEDIHIALNRAFELWG